jgi:hypothetical protein
VIIMIELCDMTYKELFDSVSFEEIVPYIKKYYDYLSDSYVVFFFCAITILQLFIVIP